ncbi:hypothetical protein Esti_003631 [Eimeria stiedai]
MVRGEGVQGGKTVGETGSVESSEEGPQGAPQRGGVPRPACSLLPTQQRARSLFLRAAAAARAKRQPLRLCVCGPPSAAADFAVYEGVALFTGQPLERMRSSMRPTAAAGAAGFSGNKEGLEAQGAPTAAAASLKWLARSSDVFSHLFCPAMGALERRPEARLLLQRLFESAAAAAAARNRNAAAAAAAAAGAANQVPQWGKKQQRASGATQHVIILEEIESFSLGLQLYLLRLLHATGLSWVLLCRGPHRLCSQLKNMSCCMRFPRPSSQELGLSLHLHATNASAAAAAVTAAPAAAAPDIAYFVSVAKAAGCEPLAALQLSRRAASLNFPPLHTLCFNTYPQQQQQQQKQQQQQQQREEEEQEEQDGSMEAEQGRRGRPFSSALGAPFLAGFSAVSSGGALIRKLHRLISRRASELKTLQSLRSVWFESFAGEHGGVLEQLDATLLLLRARLVAERGNDAAFERELTNVLAKQSSSLAAAAAIAFAAAAAVSAVAAAVAASTAAAFAVIADVNAASAAAALLEARGSAQVREGFLAAALPPSLDLLGLELLHLWDKRPSLKLELHACKEKESEGAEEGWMEQQQQPPTTPSEPETTPDSHMQKEKLSSANTGQENAGREGAEEELAEVPLFGEDE